MNGPGPQRHLGEIAEIAEIAIEQLPLYHFFPGSKTLYAGVVGTTLNAAPYDEWSADSERARNSVSLSPGELVDNALECNAAIVAIAGGEAALYLDYIEQCVEVAHNAHLRVVCRTSGCMDRESADRLAQIADAVLLELPFIDMMDFEREHGMSTDAIFASFRRFGDRELHTEIAAPCIHPAGNGLEPARRLFTVLAEEDAAAPVHLRRRDGSPGPGNAQLVQLAKRYFDHVYGPDAGHETTCPVCDALLVTRTEGEPRLVGLRQGRCRKCDRVLPGRF